MAMKKVLNNYKKSEKRIMKENKVIMPFFMTQEYEKLMNEIYDKSNIMENSVLNKEREDREYFRQMYPEEVRKYLNVVIEILNRLGGKDSFIYDEYPDKVRTERLAELILKNIPLEKNKTRESQRNIVKLLLWEEIVRRRNRENM